MLTGITLGFFGVLLARWHSASAQFDNLLLRQQAEFTQPTEHDLEVWSRPLRTFANDYSLWDEMVSYVQQPTQEWADNNIVVSLDTFVVNGAWVFNPDGSLIYGVDNQHPEQTLPPELSPERIRKLFEWQLFPHSFFAIEGGVLELCGAPIQPTADTHRTSRPLGYLLIGRYCTPNALRELAALARCDVALVPPGKQEPSGILPRGYVQNFIELCDPDGTPVGELRMRSAVPGWVEAKRSLDISLVVHTILALLLLALLLHYLNSLVLRPLGLLARGLEDRGSTALEQLERSTDEYGQLAQLIRYYAERRELVRELDLTYVPVLFEVEFAALAPGRPRFQAVSRFPQVRRDLAIVVEEATPLSAIRERVTLSASSLLRELLVFDVYRGAGIESGRKSVALGLIFQDNSRTLTDEDTDRAVAAIVADLAGTLDAKTRE